MRLGTPYYPRLMLLCVCMAAMWGSVLFGQRYLYYINHLTTAEGLQNGTNFFITRDSRGLVWLSTVSGFSVFDGATVVNYLPADDGSGPFGENVQGYAFETSNRDLYFTTYDGGVNRYIRSRDAFEHWLIEDVKGAPLAGYFAFHLQHDTLLWVLVENKHIALFNLRTRQFQFLHDVPYETQRYGLITNEQGFPVLGYSANINSLFTVVDYLPSGPKVESFPLIYEGESLPIRQVLATDRNTFWIRSRKGLFRFDLSQRRLTRKDLGTMEGDLQAMALYGTDTLLITVAGKGLLFYELSSGQIVSSIGIDPGKPHALRNEDFMSISVLSDGGVWLSTQNNGVDYFYPQKTRFAWMDGPEALKEKGVAFHVFQMATTSDGKTWCATQRGGIVVLDEQGRMVDHFHDEGPKSRRLPLNQVEFLYRDWNDGIWIHLPSHCLRWNPIKKRLEVVSNEHYISMVQIDVNRFVVAPRLGGVKEIVLSEDGRMHLRQLETFDSSNHYLSMWVDHLGRLFCSKSLTHVEVRDPSKDYQLIATLPFRGEVNFVQNPWNNSIWITCSEGLVNIPQSLDLSKKIVYTSRSTPTVMKINCMRLLGQALWLGSDVGLIRFDLQKRQFRHFDLTHGLPSNSILCHTRPVLTQERLWFGTPEGLVVVNTDETGNFTIPTQAIIKELLVNDEMPRSLKCAITGATSPSEMLLIELPFEKNTLSFRLAALDYSHPKGNKYSWFMEGIDKNWIEASPTNFVRYARMPGGHYTFRYRVLNSDGVVGLENKLQIVIRPPFYQQTWFIASMFMLGGFVVWSVMKYRAYRRAEKQRIIEERRQALEMERQRIAKDMHDDLGSSLSALTLMAQVALARQNGVSHEDLEKIKDASVEVSKKIREVIWVVSAQHDTLDSLISYLHSHFSSIQSLTDMECSITLPEKIPSLKISSEKRRSLFLSFKEALNNSLKYSKGTKLEVSIQVQDHYLVLVVSDDGVGFDISLLRNPTGNGLRNMQHRMEALGGTCRITSGPHGTTVVFSMPLRDEGELPSPPLTPLRVDIPRLLEKFPLLGRHFQT
ncbi:MAG: hypothetical protein KatS3mg029_0901 [Saprospiraceae bacterium]|nr:MAG: hypothetical protein KatS3mg029_0901 [Saprospiraceae bacterium]